MVRDISAINPRRAIFRPFPGFQPATAIIYLPAKNKAFKTP